MSGSFLWILAFLGLASLLRWIFTFFNKKPTFTPSTSLVLLVHNWESNVERVVRFIAYNCYFNQNTTCPVDVVIVDNGSTDETLSILYKLARSFNFLKIVDGGYVKKSQHCILDDTKERCQGKGIILLDTMDMDVDQVEKTIGFYFRAKDSSAKVLENNGGNSTCAG